MAAMWRIVLTSPGFSTTDHENSDAWAPFDLLWPRRGITLIESWSSRAKHETYQRGVADAGGHFTRDLVTD